MICIPITSGRHAGAMRAIERSVAAADVLELRMDLIKNGRLTALIGKAKACKQGLRILVTHRRAALSDPLQERRRIECLKEAVCLGADFVDVELETDCALRAELIEAIAGMQKRTKLIVSHHDFQRTPSLGRLKSLFHMCVAAGADIVKIVTWAGTPGDNLRILSLLDAAGCEDIGQIHFCMGPKGRISRIAAPLLGSCMSYVSLCRGAESAPGQLTVTEMNTVTEILRRDP